MSLIIVGGGIVGLSIAYYVTLTDPTRKVILVDSEKELFLSASGFSGGFIVRDWFSPSVLPLAELSFQLHRELARLHDGRAKWGYTPSIGYSLVMDSGVEGGKKVRGEDWLLHGTSRADVAREYVSRSLAGRNNNKTKVQRDPLLRPEDGSPVWANIPAGGVLEKISSPSGCAQVEPRQLCEWLLQRCLEKGVEVHLGTKPVALARDSHGSIVGLQVQKATGQQVLQCRDVVVSAGCWTPRIFRDLVGKKMSIGIRPLPGYSIVVRSPRYNRPILEAEGEAGPDGVEQQVETSHSIFYPPGPDWSYSPEAMARQTRDGKPEVYVAGLNNEAHPLPELAGGSKDMMEKPLMEDLKRTAFKLVGNQAGDDDLEIVREGLCFRPVSESGLPIICPVDGIKTKTGGRLYIASGHGPWGITLSLATGFVMAEVLQGKAPTVSLDDFRLKSDSSPDVRSRL